MIRSYHITTQSSNISMGVHVSTPGEASSRIFKNRSGGTLEKLTDSGSRPDGIISLGFIGDHLKLADTVLEIITIVELENVEKSLWDQVFKNIVVEYTLDGGPDGQQLYEYDIDDKTRSKTHKTILIKKAIRIISIT